MTDFIISLPPNPQPQIYNFFYLILFSFKIFSFTCICFAQGIKALKISWESRRTVELHMPPLACPDLALASSCPPLRVQFIAALLSSAWLGLGGGHNNRNDGCKLQTVYDTGLVTHLWVNPPKHRESVRPQLHPRSFTGRFFYSPHRPFDSSLTPLSCSFPLSFLPLYFSFHCLSV